MSAKNSSSDGGRQAGGEAIVTDTATATGGDKRGEARISIGAGAGIETNTQVVTGFSLNIEVGTDTITEAFTCRRASASV
jgi:hypothetical protein